MDPYASVRQLALRQQEKPSYIDPEATGLAQDAQLPWWTADWGALADTGFASKYNDVQDLSEFGYPGMFRVTLQNPDPASSHKYDTLDAIYKLDPETGQATLVGEPTPTRQTSGVETFRDFAEHGIPLVAGAALGGYMAAPAAGAEAGGLLSAGAYGGAGALGDASVLTGAGGAGFAGAGGSTLASSSLGGLGYGAGVSYGGSLLGGSDALGYGGVEGLLADAEGIKAGVYGEGLTADTAAGLVAPEAGMGAGLVAPEAAAAFEGTALGAPGSLLSSSAGGVPAATSPAASSAGSTVLDKLLTNPKAIGAIAGGLLGGAEGGATDGGSGEAYTGPMPTITRGGWSPSATPTYMQLPTTDYQLPTTGYANSGLWRFNGQQQQAAPQQQYQAPQQPQLMQQPQQPQHGLLGTQQPQQQGLMSQGFGRQQQQGSPSDLFSLAQQKGWIDQGGAPAGNWQNNVSKLTSAARHMGLNVGGIDQAFGMDPGTTAGYLGRQSLGSGRQDMLDRRAGRAADQEARTYNGNFNTAMARPNDDGTTGRDKYNAYLRRSGIDWQY